MSKLGKCLGYTATECPNCGRVRVEVWVNGRNVKRICEKCHWCIEEGGYYHEELEEPDEGIYMAMMSREEHDLAHLSAQLAATNFKAPNSLLVAYPTHMWLDIEKAWGELKEQVLNSCEPLVYSLSEFAEKIGFSRDDDGSVLTDVEIKRMLKHEKNPMRIKQLNKLLYGKRKGGKKK